MQAPEPIVIVMGIGCVILCKQRLNHLTMHVRQAETPTLEFESQSLMIDPQ